MNVRRITEDATGILNVRIPSETTVVDLVLSAITGMDIQDACPFAVMVHAMPRFLRPACHALLTAKTPLAEFAGMVSVIAQKLA